MYLPKLIEDTIKEYINIRISKRNQAIKNINFAVKTYKQDVTKDYIMDINRHYQKLLIYDKDDDYRYEWFKEFKDILDNYDCHNMEFMEFGFIDCLDPDFRKKLTKSCVDVIEGFHRIYPPVHPRNYWDYIDNVYKKGIFINSLSI